MYLYMIMCSMYIGNFKKFKTGEHWSRPALWNTYTGFPYQTLAPYGGSRRRHEQIWATVSIRETGFLNRSLLLTFLVLSCAWISCMAFGQTWAPRVSHGAESGSSTTEALISRMSLSTIRWVKAQSLSWCDGEYGATPVPPVVGCYDE